MPGPIETFLNGEHTRIDALLARAERPDGTIDAQVYAEFRRALLRHIAMEEKVLLPYARRKRGGQPLPMAAALRKDHGELAALLVPTPNAAIVAELRALIARHNPLEDGPGGVYAEWDALAENEAEELVERLESQPQVPVAPHYDGPLLRRRS